MTLVEELRSKQSRDNRDLLDRAADEIEQMREKLSEQQARFDQELERQHREYNMALDKIHLMYRDQIAKSKQETAEAVEFKNEGGNNDA